MANASVLKGRNVKAKETDQQPAIEVNPSQNVEDGEASREEIREYGTQAEPRDDTVRSMEAASAFSADSSPARVFGFSLF